MKPSNTAVLPVAIIGIIVVVYFLLTSQGPNGVRSDETICENHLRIILDAMDQYYDDHGKLPPAYVPDSNGIPMHSWRVLLLPYLHYGDWLDYYRMDEPWNSPHNGMLLQTIPNCYRCPADPTTKASATSYLAITGRSARFEKSSGVELDTLAPNIANRLILVAEVSNSDIQWTEPKDLDISQMSFTINATETIAIRSGHSGGAFVGFATGSRLFLPNSLDSRTVKALLHYE